ncbi:MAG: iron ABC transporter permease [Candidatus Contendobacter odensis]|uniref:Iron ABC transporter permease n=1 Tax=Candidatus Contendibacter odensensis TaxID=1400860 RepID=A0A2G6PF59_9GAMM|nr:MAG: iron ABC transporter permease [Candidatus Contendobacter odensis]
MANPHQRFDKNVVSELSTTGSLLSRFKNKVSVNRWTALVVGIASILALPVLALFTIALQPAGEVWRHLINTVFIDYVTHSLVLMLSVGLGTLLIGVPTAWWVSTREFPGRQTFEWMLLLPMAMPAYIIAYTYTGLLDFAGPVQTGLRELFGWTRQDYSFPAIRSLPGAILMLSLVLYPYVYLLARAAFLDQSVGAQEVGRTLGAGPWRRFYALALPLARPSLIAGVSLVQMEALADYGTVQYFGVSTFTTGIFRVWFGMGDGTAAAQLASVLLMFIFVLLLFERLSRQRVRFHHTGNRQPHLQRLPLMGMWKWLAVLGCALPILFGFLIPAGQLIIWAMYTAPEVVDERFLRLLSNSVFLALGAALLILLLALLLAYGQRLRPHTMAVRFAVRGAGLGYAVPGTVLAIGVMLPFAAIDQHIDTWARDWLGISTGLLLSGTLIALLFAYTVRFLPIALHGVEAGLTRIRPSMDDAARSLGATPRAVLQRVHVPILRTSLLTALLLVFVDVLKELPATLVLRPFNFNTLAVRTFELASDERLADSASFALAIVLAGIGPVILLSRAISQAKPGHDSFS